MSCQRYISVVLSAAALSVVVLFAAACGLRPVSSIRIKTSPELYVPLSAKSFSANEYISPTSFADMLKSGNSSGRKGQIYYYNPPNLKEEDAAQLRYLIHYPLQSIPVDVNNYFGKERADSVLSRSFDTSIDIPKIEKTVSSAVDSNEINTKLLKVFNERYSSTSPSVPLGGTAGDYSLPAVPIKFNGFSRLIFEDSPDSALTISTASSANYVIASGTLTISGVPIAGVPNGKSIRFPLAGRTIIGDHEMPLQITIRRADTTGGNVTITPKLEGTIAQVEGVTADLDVISLEEKQMEIALPEGFRSAKIDTGSLNLDVQRSPGWSGISISHKTHIKQEGAAGLNLAPAGFTAVGTPIDLAGQQLNSNRQFTYKPVLKVTLNDATYTRSDTPIQAECSVSIGKFETVTLANRQDFTKDQNEPVPSDMKKWVQSIRIKKVTAKVVLTNNLPEGNPININLESTVFGINGTDKHGASGVFPAQVQNKEVKYPGRENFDLPITSETKFDLKSTVLPGSPEGSDVYTLKNIETGKKVEFSGKVEFDIDWESMVVKADGGKGSSFPEGDLLRLPMLSKLKKAGIQLDKIPMYFYAGSNSNLFGDTEVKLDLSVESLTENGISTPKPLLSESHKLVPLPADAFKDAEGEEGKTKTLTKAVPEPMFTVHDLDKTLNTYPDGIRFNYTISMDNGVTITREAYNKAKEGGSATINVDLLLEIPIGFTVSSGGELELYSATEAIDLKDSFNKLPIGEEQFKLRKLQLNANLENESGFTPAFILRIKNRGDKGRLLDDKEISLAPGNQELKFTSEEWDKLKEAGAFIPELYLKLEPDKSYAIKKDAELKANLFVTVAADVDYKVY
ncbi:MAG: hypothetical protein ACTTI6_03870 [Treponema sp.]|uniref:hypothetical protein n=1 Tax=Treponema sp. TaxID=166 RepID=UPI003FA1C768